MKITGVQKKKSQQATKSNTRDMVAVLVVNTANKPIKSDV